MRVGITVSVLGHLAILGFGFVAFPEAEPFHVVKIEALPVDLVEIADVTDLLAGDKQAELAPPEAPQPKPRIAKWPRTETVMPTRIAQLSVSSSVTRPIRL